MRLLLSPSPKPDRTHSLNIKFKMEKICYDLFLDIECAETCLVLYSYDFGRIYGKHHMVFNTHGLPQMAKDCKRFGNLNNISCFRPESFLGTVKRSIRGKRNPLTQLYKKINQLHNYQPIDWLDAKRGLSVLDHIKADSTANSTVELKKGETGPIFLIDIYYSMIISTGLIVRVTKIDSDSNYVECLPFILALDEFDEYLEYFDSPLRATQIGIFVSVGLQDRKKKVFDFFSIYIINK